MGVAFRVGKAGPELYFKTTETLGLYAEIIKCLKSKQAMTPRVAKLAESHSLHEKRVGKYWKVKLMKTERVLDVHLCNVPGFSM